VRFEVDAFLTPGSSNYARAEFEREEITAQSGTAVVRTASTLTVNERTHTTANLALGAEVFVAPRFSLLFGAQSDFSALEDLEPEVGEARLFRTKLDYYRAGAGLCSYTDYGDLIVGLRFDYGVGEAAPANTLVVPSALGRASVHEFGLMAVLAGSLSWRSIQKAVDDLGEVVKGSGGPPPTAAPPPMRPPKHKE